MKLNTNIICESQFKKKKMHLNLFTLLSEFIFRKKKNSLLSSIFPRKETNIFKKKNSITISINFRRF